MCNPLWRKLRLFLAAFCIPCVLDGGGEPWTMPPPCGSMFFLEHCARGIWGSYLCASDQIHLPVHWLHASGSGYPAPWHLPVLSSESPGSFEKCQGFVITGLCAHSLLSPSLGSMEIPSPIWALLIGRVKLGHSTWERESLFPHCVNAFQKASPDGLLLHLLHRTGASASAKQWVELASCHVYTILTAA